MFAHRTSVDVEEYAASLLRPTGTDWLLVDDGFPAPGTGIEWERLGELADARARPILRIETRGAGHVARARADGFVALKTIAAYRGGLAEPAPGVVRALEDNAATGDPLPVQVHTGFGDADLSLPLSRPGLLKPLIERFDTTPFVLLHCYPFMREASYLAHVFPQVHVDVGLAITFAGTAGASDILAASLELTPFTKTLFSSDAFGLAELYFLGTLVFRRALGGLLQDRVGSGEWAEPDALRVAQLIGVDNARRVYRLGAG